MRFHLPLAVLLALTACASGGRGAALHRDHPLVGRIWDVRQGRFIEQPALDAALARADLVLLGETHDNPDHHLLEARVLRALVAAGRRPAVAFEMLDVKQQAAVDAALARAPRDPDALAAAVGWAKSGWPDFAIYRPVFAAALDAGLPVLAANITRQQARQVVEQGADALSPPVKAVLDRTGPLPEDVARAARSEMFESHCRELPETMLDPMVTMQRARDAQMTERLLSADVAGALLVAGSGHVRTDRGVPLYLAREAPDRTRASVAFLEVSPARTTPQAYGEDFGAGGLPFDYVVFTPATQREDPCKALRNHKPAGPRAPAEKPAGTDL